MARRRPFRALLALPAAALLAVAAASPASAARLPDWAEQVAESAPPLPPGVPDTSFRDLLSEIVYSVRPDGSFRIRRRLAVQALSVNTDDVDSGWFHFDETARVTSSKAWHLPPGKTSARKSHYRPVDVTVGESFLTGSKVRVLHVDGVRKGSIVFFEFEAEEMPYGLSLMRLFYEGAPVALMRFRLETPPGWKIRSAWPRGGGPEAAVSGDTREWVLQDLPAPEKEPLAVPPSERAPLLVVDFLPPPGASPASAAFPDWASFSRWYEGLLKGRADVTPAVAAAAKRAAAGAAAGVLERIRAEGTFVRDNVRYLDVELGLGNLQPRPAADTLANLYGDCKDKGTLFQAVLAAEGIASYPILVNATQRHVLSEEVPAWVFDHYVVGVPLPGDLEAPSGAAGALADAGDLGRLLVVDTTDEYTPVGSLSALLAGKRALVVAGPRTRVITLPAAEPGEHRVTRKLLEQIQPDGSLVVERDSRLTGQPAANARFEARQSSRDRRKEAEGDVMQRWPDASILDYSTVPESSDGSFEETLKYRRPALTRQGPSPVVELFPGAADDLPRVPLTHRKTAVEYGYPRTIRYETVVKGVPAGLVPPDPQELHGEGWSVTTTYAHEGNDVKGIWELRLSRTRFEPATFPELRRLWSAASTAGGWLLMLPD